jgi:hypothetical protein
MVLISEGYEAEGLQAGGFYLRLRLGFRAAHRLQHFCHAVDRAGLGLEGDLYEIAGGELALQLQQASGYGNGLKFCARSTATFYENGSWNGTIEMDSRRAPGGVGLGEVSHAKATMTLAGRAWQITKAGGHGRMLRVGIGVRSPQKRP